MYAIAIVQLDWHDNIANKTVTNTTQTSYAGALTSLKIKTNPATQVVPIPQVAPYNIWSVTGNDAAVKTYEQTYSKGAFTPMNMAVDPSLYWIYSSATGNYGNASTIYVLAEIIGKIQGDTVDRFEGAGSVPVIFNVLGPTNVSMTSMTGTVLLGPDPVVNNDIALSFGNPPAGAPGIDWTFNATGPSGTGGDIGAIQLVNTKATMVPVTGTTPQPPLNTNGKFFLDEPIANAITYADTSTPLLAGQNASWQNLDAPARDLTSLKFFQRQDQFQTWFVYKPRIANSIWVPLGYVQWNWGGTATLNGSSWVLSGASATPNPSATIPNAYTSIPFFAWTRHLP